LPRRFFAAESVAWFFVAAGAGFVPLAARGVTDDVAEAAEGVLKAFVFMENDATGQESASHAADAGPVLE
jgi:hypothetical protein